MQSQIPHFKHCAKGRPDKQYGFIEIDGRHIHNIENVDEFYSTFGYTIEMAKTGVLPDEFIWTEYIKDAPVAYTNCLQIHIMEYLIKHSDTFRKKYGEEYENWIAAHEKTVSERGVLCVTCRMKPFCSNRKMKTEQQQVTMPTTTLDAG